LSSKADKAFILSELPASLSFSRSFSTFTGDSGLLVNGEAGLLAYGDAGLLLYGEDGL